MQTILITGGAGFVGRHVAAELLAQGHRVRALDSLISQVHPEGRRPADLPEDVELMIGDVRDGAAVRRALRGVDKVVHLAAEVGVGQSMYAIERYTSANELGTAVLFQELIERPVARVVTASSMSIYGEGLYRTATGEMIEDVVREGRNRHGGWDPLDAEGRPLTPAPTPETKRPNLRSVYAINKFVQERFTLTLTAQYGMEGCALRLWNIYGPGQALSNPYTGVLAIFAARLANGQRPMVFEDGAQLRDFVHISDVARAFALALAHPAAPGEVFNIGSGESRSVAEVARLQARAMGCEALEPEITGKARAGDIRHNIPDLAKAQRELGYEAKTSFAVGLGELSEWVARQEAHDRVGQARQELEARGLVA